MNELSSSHDSPRVAIVVLNYNGEHCLPRCLSSLQKLDYGNFFVIAIDNGSSDGSYPAAVQSFPQFTFEQLPTNRGFAAGMNYGIARALERGAEFVWVFNNDAEPQPNALSLLVKVAQENPQAGLLSPLVLSSRTQRIWFGKARVQWWRMRVIHEEPTHSELQSEAYKSECLTGCALLIRTSVIEQAGGFDERFFLYYEDADLSLRARQFGFQSLVVPGARVYHLEQSQENPKKLYFLVLSGLLFFQKHADGWWRLYLVFYVTMRRIKNRFDVLCGGIGAASVRRAYNDFYHG